MSEFKEIAISKANKLRTDYSIGNYCGRSLFQLIEKMKLTSKNSIHLIRLPFKEIDISGFIGYKNDQFVIFTNTNKTLGYEIFTLAHEIYHLIENESIIKKEVILEESKENRYVSDDIADMFAAELLMPQIAFKNDFNQLMIENNLKKPDRKLIIELQQQYYVEYKSITKRLKEIGLIDNYYESFLNEILDVDTEIYDITKRLGFSNELNEPSNAIQIPRRFLNIIEGNYERDDITFDDLSVLFSYCNSTPEKFGYKENGILSENAKSLLEKLNKVLGSD